MSTPKQRLGEVMPDAAEWVFALYPKGDGQEFYWNGIDDAELAKALRSVATQIERRIVPDPDSGTQH